MNPNVIQDLVQRFVAVCNEPTTNTGASVSVHCGHHRGAT